MKDNSHNKLVAQSQLFHGRSSANKKARNLRKKNKPVENVHRDLFQEWAEEREEHKYNLKNSLIKSSIRNQENQAGRSLTEAKKKQKQMRTHELHPENNIFKLPSSTIISHKMIKDDIRLPALDKKKIVQDAIDPFNPEHRRVIRIPMQKLKPLPTDEVKRRFMLKYQFQGIKS